MKLFIGLLRRILNRKPLPKQKYEMLLQLKRLKKRDRDEQNSL
jgi:hypothetical protein